MDFKEAYQKMLEGNKVRRKGDNGYFYYDENTMDIPQHILESEQLSDAAKNIYIYCFQGLFCMLFYYYRRCWQYE